MPSRIKIEVKNLSKTFGNLKVLDNINLEIRYDEALVIIGGSGSGKSVLIRCIAGLLMPDRNSSILIDHNNVSFKHISQRVDFVKKFGMLFQSNALFDSLPIWHNIAFALFESAQCSEAEAKNIAKQKLEMVELKSNILNLYPSEISGGMQKRVAIARAIASDPTLLFFDEPTSGLDPITSKAISNLIKTLTKQLNIAAVIITHDLACMRITADKIAVLKTGNLIWHGAIESIASAVDPYIQEFIK